MKRSVRYIISFALLFLLLMCLTAVNIYCGSVSIDGSIITDILLGRENGSAAVNIIRGIRIPRMIAAAVLGGGLSVSGFLLQTYFSNPIAGPFVLGISSGAKLVVAFVMIISVRAGFALNSAHLIGAAFAGSLMSMGFILGASTGIRKSSSLIVCGVMIGYICSAITDFAVTFAEDSNIVNLHNWSMGSFSGIDIEDAGVITAVIGAAVVITFLFSKQIGAYQVGETYARSMGVNIKAFRIVLILLSSILSAAVTAYAGPVSFVGIAVPHLVRSLFGTSKPQVIIPAAFIGGADFCLFCDLLARVMFAPSEVSISAVTAVFGAPVVIFIMMRKK